MDESKEELHVKGQEPITEEEGQAQQAEDAPTEKKGSILSAPGNYGNMAGEKIQGTLSKVGQPVGKGLETIAAPVGGLVEPLVGGLFKAPQTFGTASDMAKKEDEHNDFIDKPIAGQEKTADNPLGLHEGGKEA